MTKPASGVSNSTADASARQLTVAVVLTGAVGAMLIGTGIWALTFEVVMSAELRRTLNGHSLTSAGWLVLSIGVILIACVVGVLVGRKAHRWLGLVSRLVAIVAAIVAALCGVWLVAFYPGWAITYTVLGAVIVYAYTLYERELQASWPWAPLRAQVAKVFALNTKGLFVPRGVAVAGFLLITLVVIRSLHEDRYFLSVAFGLLFVTLTDPGGEYVSRLGRVAVVGLVGALLTALGFGIGGGAWGFVVLAIFVLTVVSGLLVGVDLQALTAGTLLNVWFLIALSVAAALPAGADTHPWNQALAWLIGSAIAVALMSLAWLARGRSRQPSPLPEIPSDVPTIGLSRPVILFVLIRATAVSISVAIAFGLSLSNADWMPLATLIAMKPDLQQSSLRGAQRLVGTALGAGIAAVFLVTATSHRALEEIVILLMGIGASIYAVNYAFYAAAIAGAVLIALDLPHPTNLDAEGRRIFFTFVGIAIAIVVMILATLLQKRSAPTAADRHTVNEGHGPKVSNGSEVEKG